MKTRCKFQKWVDYVTYIIWCITEKVAKTLITKCSLLLNVLIYEISLSGKRNNNNNNANYVIVNIELDFLFINPTNFFSDYWK